jgi:hypothetical protein
MPLFGRTCIFALFVSSNAILVISHGFFQAGPYFTALVLVALTALLAISAPWKAFNGSTVDLCYVALVFSICTTFLINGKTTDLREVILLILTLAAYPALRVAPVCDKRVFLWITGAIVAVGTTATVFALIQQWDNHHGKPFVFGVFDAAPIQFLTSLGFALLAAVCSRLDRRRTILISAIIFVPTAIYGASQVRFTFVAIEGALLLAVLMVEPGQRRYLLSILAVFALACVAGMLARPSATQRYLRQEFKIISPASAAPAAIPQPIGAPGGADACSSVDLYDSISIRKRLFSEALSWIPSAGIFGIGLDAFQHRSCLQSIEVHNSFLQAALEFGWLGVASFFMLVVSVLLVLLPLARRDDEARFVISSLAFMVIESAAHGRISRDQLLFVFLGYGVGLHQRLYRGMPLGKGLAMKALNN